MTRKKKEKRNGERVRAALPVDLNGVSARARNVSATGIFLETDAAYTLGSPVRLALDLDTPWGKVMSQYEGRIVRVEHHDEKVGVAVQFTDSEDSVVTRKFRSAPE